MASRHGLVVASEVTPADDYGERVAAVWMVRALPGRRSSAVDGRTTRHMGYAQSFNARLKPQALFGANSSLGPEGSIENLHGDPSRISLGANSFCRGHLLLYGHGGQISIGDWSYIGVRSEIWSMDSINIGNRVLISHDVNIHDGSAHSLNPLERHQHFRRILECGHPKERGQLPGVFSSPIVIEDDVWISFGVTILRGVHIGAGSVMAAGSIVTKDVPPGMLYRNRVTPILQSLSSRFSRCTLTHLLLERLL
jgi:maltose O-acetyltransferase